MPPMVALRSGSDVHLDSRDMALIQPYTWYTHNEGYAVSSGGKVLMHRLIMGARKGEIIDHRDGNRLNNHRANLRRTTFSRNGHNRHVSAPSSTGVTGVRKDERGRFPTYIWINNRNTYLGTFDSLLDAATARAKAERAHCGETSPNTRRWLEANKGGDSNF